MATNPYASQLRGFTASIPNAKRALAEVYKLRIRQRQGLSNEVRKLYGTEYNALSTQLRNAGLAYGEAQAGGERLLAESGYQRGGELQGNEGGFLTGIVKGGVDPFRAYTTSTLGAQQRAVKGYKAADIGELRTLVAGLRKERPAAAAELEQGIVDTQTNLQTEATAFAQQQAYNQQLQSYYQAATAAAQQTAGGFSGSGRETPNTARWQQYASQRWGVQVGGWRATGSVPNSDHPKGRAIDIMVSGPVGDQVAGDFVMNAAARNVSYVIWNWRIWTPRFGWRRYNGPSGHTDHVHVSFTI